MTPLLAQRPKADRAFEKLYRRHVGDVYRYALAVLRNPADAEDVTQTTFLNAYRSYQQGERPRTAQNWLIAIAHNVCRQRFRQSARRPQEVEFVDEVAGAPPEEDGPTAGDIRRALSHLAFNQRAALVLRELEGRSYTEIAQTLELSVSAVETLIFRARRALREQLEGGLTCHEAELSISKQVDGRLARGERGPLRAHLRECADCSTFARSQRAQRSAWKALGAIPLPSSLSSFFGGGGGAAVGTGGAAVGTGLAAKAAAVLAAGAVVAGAGYEGAKQIAPASAGRSEAAARVDVQVPLGPAGATRVASRSGVIRSGEARSGQAEKLKSTRVHSKGKASTKAAPGRIKKSAGAAAGPQQGEARGGPGAVVAKQDAHKADQVAEKVQKAIEKNVPTGNAVGHDKTNVPATVQSVADAVPPAPSLDQVAQEVEKTVTQAVQDVPTVPVPTVTVPTVTVPKDPPTVKVPTVKVPPVPAPRVPTVPTVPGIP